MEGPFAADYSTSHLSRECTKGKLPPFGGMTYVRTELYLVRLSADVGTDVPQEFLVPDKRRRIVNPHEPDRSLKGSRSGATVDHCQ